VRREIAARVPGLVEEGQAHRHQRLQWYLAPVLAGAEQRYGTEPRLDFDHGQAELNRLL
jgi:hypothetical protein